MQNKWGRVVADQLVTDLNEEERNQSAQILGISSVQELEDLVGELSEAERELLRQTDEEIAAGHFDKVTPDPAFRDRLRQRLVKKFGP